MDVRKKFTLGMMILGTIIIILGVLVYLGATKGPINQSDENRPLNQAVGDIEFIAGSGDQGIVGNETQPVQEDEATPENPVAATIILEDPKTPEEEITQDNRALADLEGGEEIYTLRLRSAWSNQTHPNWHPEGSHLSPLIAWSHGLKDVLFKSGGIASKGMEIMAETGAPPTLVGEIEEYIIRGSILDYGVGSVFYTPGESEIQIRVSRSMPYVTVVSMIAPSPDWFITARNIKLLESGRWMERVNIPAVLYDAGTDSGKEFNSKDEDTQPKKPIGMLKNPPLLPIATFEFVRN